MSKGKVIFTEEGRLDACPLCGASIPDFLEKGLGIQHTMGPNTQRTIGSPLRTLWFCGVTCREVWKAQYEEKEDAAPKRPRFRRR